MIELLTFHSGLGVLITAFAAYALPGLALPRREVPATAAADGAAAPAGADGAADRPAAAGTPVREPAAADPAVREPARR